MKTLSEWLLHLWLKTMFLLLQPQRSWLQNRSWWFLNTLEWGLLVGTHTYSYSTLPYQSWLNSKKNTNRIKKYSFEAEGNYLIWSQIYPKNYLLKFQIGPQKLTATAVLQTEHPIPSHLKPTSISWIKKTQTNPKTQISLPLHPKLDIALAITNWKYSYNVFPLKL